MSSVDDTSIDELCQRLREINEQVKNLLDEKEKIELKLQENFEKNKLCISNSNINTNTQNSSNNTNKNSILEGEEER